MTVRADGEIAGRGRKALGLSHELVAARRPTGCAGPAGMCPSAAGDRRRDRHDDAHGENDGHQARGSRAYTSRRLGPPRPHATSEARRDRSLHLCRGSVLPRTSGAHHGRKVVPTPAHSIQHPLTAFTTKLQFWTRCFRGEAPPTPGCAPRTALIRADGGVRMVRPVMCLHVHLLVRTSVSRRHRGSKGSAWLVRCPYVYSRWSAMRSAARPSP